MINKQKTVGTNQPGNYPLPTRREALKTLALGVLGLGFASNVTGAQEPISALIKGFNPEIQTALLPLSRIVTSYATNLNTLALKAEVYGKTLAGDPLLRNNTLLAQVKGEIEYVNSPDKTSPVSIEGNPHLLKLRQTFQAEVATEIKSLIDQKYQALSPEDKKELEKAVLTLAGSPETQKLLTESIISKESELQKVDERLHVRLNVQGKKMVFIPTALSFSDSVRYAAENGLILASIESTAAMKDLLDAVESKGLVKKGDRLLLGMQITESGNLKNLSGEEIPVSAEIIRTSKLWNSKRLGQNVSFKKLEEDPKSGVVAFVPERRNLCITSIEVPGKGVTYDLMGTLDHQTKVIGAIYEEDPRKKQPTLANTNR